MLAQRTGASFPSARDVDYAQLIVGFCRVAALGIMESDVGHLGRGATMAQIFHPSTNTIARVSIFGIVILLGAMLWLVAAISRSSYIPQAGVVREQPVPFSHKHHVSGLGIDCRYCHAAVEESSFAGMPTTKTCMTCHA
jgi:hypothetical protein